MSLPLLVLAPSHHHYTPGLTDMVARWVAHAALWRLVWSLPLTVTLAAGLLALLLLRARRG